MIKKLVRPHDKQAWRNFCDSFFDEQLILIQISKTVARTIYPRMFEYTNTTTKKFFQANARYVVDHVSIGQI